MIKKLIAATLLVTYLDMASGQALLSIQPPVASSGRILTTRSAWDSVALTPPMGWNSWNFFAKPNINESIVREVIDAMVKEGLKEAGYKYVVVDGGWRDTKLSPKGELLPNPQRFPGGIKALVDYAHSKGLLFGLHTVPGTHDCAGDKVGGLGHEAVQLQQFIDWGVDFIKLDRCRIDGAWSEEKMKEVYTLWSDLIKKCGKKILLNVSAYKFRDWNPDACHMSRTTGDIMAKANIGNALFDGKARNVFLSIMSIAEENSLSASYARPGYWNDPDMLVTGAQGLSIQEQQSHFALWCIMSSPLFLGNDPRFLIPGEKDIITNKDCIAIDQDPTEQGRRVQASDSTEVWAKKLKNGKVAVLLLNRNSYAAKNITLNFDAVGLRGNKSVKDVYTGKSLGNFSRRFTATIRPISSQFLLL